MGRRLERLKAKQVENKRQPGYHPDGGGLYLQVSDTLTKSWIFRYELNGRERQMGLGSVEAVNLAEARKRAGTYRGLLHDRIDPIQARNAERAERVAKSKRSITFRDCAQKYVEAHRAGWKNAKHADQWASTLETYGGPVIGALPVCDVDTGLVIRILEPIWTKKPETASRLRGRIESVLDWARVRGYRIGDNPARWRGHLQKLLPALKKQQRVKHHPALAYDLIGAFMEQLRVQEGTAARALEFTILTAGRTGEVINAKPGELDLNKAIWIVPAERMKAGREHRVPLSARAVEIAKAQLGGEWLFPGMDESHPLSNMAMLALLGRMKRKDLTVHGFRSSFRDWASEQTNYPREVCEMALAHTIGDKAEAAYRRGDLFEKRRRLMLEWAKYCDRPAKSAKVTPIRKAG